MKHDPDESPRVMISGPTPPPTGGIAGVIETTLSSELATRFRFSRFDMTKRRARSHGLPGRLLGSVMARGLGFDGYFYWETPAKLAAFRAALDAETPDLVHLHSSHGYDFLLSARMGAMARARGVRVLHHVHGNFDVFHPRWSRLRRRVFRHTLTIPDRLVVLSESWRQWFSALMDPARIAVLPNAVDTGRFRPRESAAPRGGVRILFVGMIEPGLKGAYDLLAAAPEVIRQIPQVTFVCVGRDTDSIEAQRVRGTPLAPHFEFHGQRKPDEMPAEYQDADLLVLPSHWEGMPLAILEAMSSGLPVVASAINAIPSMLPPEAGLLIPPRDPPALARALVELALDPDRCAAMGRQNRIRAEREHGIGVYIRRLEDLYRSVLTDGAPRGAGMSARSSGASRPCAE